MDTQRTKKTAARLLQHTVCLGLALAVLLCFAASPVVAAHQPDYTGTAVVRTETGSPLAQQPAGPALQQQGEAAARSTARLCGRALSMHTQQLSARSGVVRARVQFANAAGTRRKNGALERFIQVMEPLYGDAFCSLLRGMPAAAR